ncbi:hypothetical protein BGZ95_011010 [Linnemannia exigua]|uniref:F-box domain-containing protein n=1 Tax=Linnemannia exigua TaxID=604196 RepID=A0AAD4DK20_9FUNG|nr:hypothetical protein BGZ95_011010 [Linnemannia exigua]
MQLSNISTSRALQVFIRLPEMLSALGSQMEPPDLLSCILVCRLWYDTMLPRLWHSIDDTKNSFPKILSLHDSDAAKGDKDEAWVLTIFAKHGHFIRHLTTRTKVVIKAVSLSGTCTDLVSFTTKSLVFGLTLKEREEQSYMDDLNRNYHESQDQAQGGPIISPLFMGVMRPGAPGARTLEHQDQDWYIAQHFWLIIYQNRSLRQLHLDWSLETLFRVTSKTFAYEMVARLKYLERLEDGLVLFQLGRLLDVVPHLLHFKASYYHILDMSTFTKQRQQQYCSLRTLRLDEYVATENMLRLLHHLPSLDELYIMQLLRTNDETVFRKGDGDDKAILHSTPSRLKMLTIYRTLFEFDWLFNTVFLPRLPSLTEFRTHTLHPETSRALAVHCPKLEVFRQLGHTDTIHPNYTSIIKGSIELTPLLEGCPNLKIVDATHHMIIANRLLSSNDAPWACLGLQHLRCQITGIDRLTMQEQSELDKAADSVEQQAVMEKYTRSQYQQRQIYQRLAGLQHLTTCDLGFEYRQVRWLKTKVGHERDMYSIGGKEYIRYTGPIYDTLDLSLDSGLYQLASLKRLEVFGFEGVFHQIGRRELQWMATSWPRLRVLRGLHEDKMTMVEPDARRNELREYMRGLRPDVRHASLVVDDSQHSWPKLLAVRDSDEAQGHQDDEWLHRIFVKYGAHIRLMEIHCSAMFAFANRSGTCINLRRIAVYDLNDGETLKDVAESNLIMFSEPGDGGRTLDETNSPGEMGPLLSPLLENVFEPKEAMWRTVTQQRRDWMSHQHLWLLIRKNPSLCSLQLDYSLHHLSTISSVEFFYSSMALLPNLVEFQCDGVMKGLGALLESLPRLERLASCSGFLDNAVPYKTFTQLRELNAWVDFSSRDFFLLLKRLPNLEYLHCTGLREASDDNFVDAQGVLDNTPSSLTRLQFEIGNDITDKQMATYLMPWLPRLTEFVDTELRPLTIAALRVHCRNIERVGQLRKAYAYYPERGCRPQVNELNLLLRTCPRLKSLDRIRVQVEMHELLAYPWASTSLERISCQVSGVTRLTKSERATLKQLEQVSENDGLELSKEEERVLAKASQSREQQRKIYDRFGSMKNLKLLDFGYDYGQLVDMETGQYLGHYGGSIYKDFMHLAAPIKDTLELNLASGLSRLGGLLELEVFGFDGMDHCIGKAELAWMVDHWPRLKTVRGLQLEEFDGSRRKQKKLELRLHLRALRPGCVFAGRF